MQKKKQNMDQNNINVRNANAGTLKMNYENISRDIKREERLL